jgi:hypothetical protein
MASDTATTRDLFDRWERVWHEGLFNLFSLDAQSEGRLLRDALTGTVYFPTKPATTRTNSPTSNGLARCA